MEPMGCFLLILNLRRSDFFALRVALRPKNGWQEGLFCHFAICVVLSILHLLCVVHSPVFCTFAAVFKFDCKNNIK